MPNNNNQILGWIILAGLVVFVLIAILQFLTVIFMILTIIAILATIMFLVFGFMDECERENYFLYAGIAFLLIFAFFFMGQATYSASEVLQNNEMTKGLMQVTSAFFFIEDQKQQAINTLENAQIDALNNITNSLP
jgi:predicted PurR-regulated permease PerM